MGRIVQRKNAGLWHQIFGFEIRYAPQICEMIIISHRFRKDSMKEYPHIDNSSKAPIGEPCIAFYKYDGSNLRWEWNPKRGWYKYGTRTRLFDSSDPIFGEAVTLFQDTMGEELARRCRSLEKGLQRAVVFTEFLGPNSFCGIHEPSDPKCLKLFDVNLYKRGIMKPREFKKNFGDLSYAAEIVYDGILNEEFIEDVRREMYPVFEGVVAKGDNWMCKIKTYSYLAKLKEVYAAGWKNYWE